MLVFIRWSVREVCSYFDIDDHQYKRLCARLFTEDELKRFVKVDVRRAYCLYIAGIQGRTRYMKTAVVEPELIVRISLYLKIPIPIDVLSAYEGKIEIIS